MARKILRNAVQCKLCGEVIESFHTHDFKWCACGNVAVDGGRDALKRCFKASPKDVKDLSEFATDETDTGARP